MVRLSPKAFNFAAIATRFAYRDRLRGKPDFGRSLTEKPPYDITSDGEYYVVPDGDGLKYLSGVRKVLAFYHDDRNLPPEDSDEYIDLGNDLALLESIEKSLELELSKRTEVRFSMGGND